MRNIKAELFKRSLAEWDRYKAEMDGKLKAGEISKDDHDRLMREKADELDL